MWCDVVWCFVIWCDVIWCGVVWCTVIWCDLMWCHVIWFQVMQWDGMLWYLMWLVVKTCDVMRRGFVMCWIGRWCAESPQQNPWDIHSNRWSLSQYDFVLQSVISVLHHVTTTFVCGSHITWIVQSSTLRGATYGKQNAMELRHSYILRSNLWDANRNVASVPATKSALQLVDPSTQL